MKLAVAEEQKVKLYRQM